MSSPDSEARQRAAATKRRRTRQAVLDAARALFEEQGWSPTTVESIARAAGVGTATFYNHFSSKNVLAGHVYRPVVEDLLDDPRWADPSLAARTALEVLIEEVTVRARAHTRLTVALLEAVNDSTARNGHAITEDDARYWVPLPPLFVTVIARGQESGEFVAYPSAADAGPLLSNLLLLRVFTRPAEDVAATTRLIATVALRLLAPPDPEGR
jgi:AcrR family transcriptional regulator